ncbi:conserved hypothetical protein [Leishmania mexicana MHOM/GT/2001/U1103]|uniref:Uncharacterized protein n=1 Tax=Leishmania mexicana (strain MHOM/GT/2001/U1103) TaxID=929439 RepID=E9AW79_LEIMU|nr:conserved hypothetical protein [Leishmania mexicana MHOM/GT/2001/U1103]CBZ27213.1 conserved hypothetical protein [Leishmania mexicana MHOM/GT/2001/U1103]
MKLFHAISRRRTLLCVAVVLLFLAVMMTFVRAHEEVDASMDAAGERVAQHISVTEKTTEEARAAAAAVQTAEAEADVEEKEELAERQRRQEELLQRREQLAALRRREEEQAALHHRQEEERQRQLEEREREEEERQREEEERQREEQERQRQLEEREREEEERQREEEERQREEQERRREEEERQRQEEERRREEEERQRQLEERQREEQERQRQLEERRRQEKELAERRLREEEELERREEEERAKRRIDSVDMIHYSAEMLPQGCAKGVEEYLFRVHEHRQHKATAVRDARSALNEARVHAPNKVAELEKWLAARQDDLLVYDIQTLRMYGGSVPKTCIEESQAWLDSQPDLSSMGEYKQRAFYLLRLTTTHCKTLYLTASGFAQYLIHSYTPVVESYTKSVEYYCDKATAIYAELLPASGKRPDMPLMDLAKKAAVMVGYAAVPIGLGVAAGTVAVTVLPPVVAALIIYDYVYKIWVELFIAYYTYGAKMPDGVVTAVKSTVAAARAGDWTSIGDSMLDALVDLIPDAEDSFYNGILAVYLLSSVAVICAMLIFVWCSCCIGGMRGKKTAKPYAAASHSASGSSNDNKKASATGGAAAAAAKKKN